MRHGNKHLGLLVRINALTDGYETDLSRYGAPYKEPLAGEKVRRENVVSVAATEGVARVS